MRASSSPAATSTRAKPGDDLNDLAKRFGSVRLEAGTYALDRPLVLDRPITISGEPGAKLVFSQKEGDAPWSTAIKIHSGHTTLEGFAVRFATPIRWIAPLRDDQAVIGVTDASDGGPRDLKADLNFRNLDLEGPPPTAKHEEAPRLIRLGYSVCGTILGNTLRGRRDRADRRAVEDRGQHPQGDGPGVADVFHPLDPPHARPDRPRQRGEAGGAVGQGLEVPGHDGLGDGDLIENNTVAGVGPRDDDDRSENAPEIVLTEAYSLHFEGRPSALSADGRILVVPPIQGDPAGVGDLVAILYGPSAGQYRRIAQALGPTTYLMETPLPRGDYAISIATGFHRLAFRGNTIDARGGTAAADLVLAGNVFGADVSNNHFLGGPSASSPPPPRTPSTGAGPAPRSGIDPFRQSHRGLPPGRFIGVEHSKPTRSGRGRAYVSAVVKDNVASGPTNSCPGSRTTRALHPAGDRPAGLARRPFRE